MEEEDLPRPAESAPLSSTMQLLITDLEAARTHDNTLSVDRMISAARSEYYNDKFIYPRGQSSTPIIDLMSHARKVGLVEIERQALTGKYDESIQ